MGTRWGAGRGIIRMNHGADGGGKRFTLLQAHTTSPRKNAYQSASVRSGRWSAFGQGVGDTEKTPSETEGGKNFCRPCFSPCLLVNVSSRTWDRTRCSSRTATSGGWERMVEVLGAGCSNSGRAVRVGKFLPQLAPVLSEGGGLSLALCQRFMSVVSACEAEF